MRRLLAALAGVLCLAAATDPAEQLPDPAQEARARELFSEFRCVVCQSESIADSNADIARDLRRLVREQVAAGRTDAQIRDSLSERYGEFILMRPKFTAGNAILWVTPFLIVLGGLGALVVHARRSPPLKEEPLSQAEQQELEALVARSAGSDAPDIKAP